MAKSGNDNSQHDSYPWPLSPNLLSSRGFAHYRGLWTAGTFILRPRSTETTPTTDQQDHPLLTSRAIHH